MKIVRMRPVGGLSKEDQLLIQQLKIQINQKIGEVYYDSNYSRYLGFSDIKSRDTYLSNPENNYNLVLGKWGFNISKVTLTLTNTADNVPLINTKVVIEGEEKFTNETGQVLYNLSKGNYKVHVDYPKASIKEITVVENIENISLSYYLPATDKTYMVFTVGENENIYLGAYFSAISQVNWGDGTIDNNSSHTYVTAGDYDVIITHPSSTLFTFMRCRFLKEIKSVGRIIDKTDYSNSFNSCSLLTTIHPGALDNWSNGVSFNNCFAECTSLTAIPSGLFDKCTNVSGFANGFAYCFKGCTILTTIPKGLFDNNINAYSFEYCFSNCTSLTTVPEGLFDNNVSIRIIRGAFYNCTSLNQTYNLTSSHLPKLWERDGTNGAVIDTYASFASGAHTTFRDTVPKTWGGNLNTVTITVKDVETNAAFPDTTVTINGKSKVSGSDGIVKFYLLNGTYDVAFSNPKYPKIPKDSIVVNEDTSKEFVLEEDAIKELAIDLELNVTNLNEISINIGSLNGRADIDWGDGTIEDLKTVTFENNSIIRHTYSSLGVYRIKISTSGILYSSGVIGSFSYTDFKSNKLNKINRFGDVVMSTTYDNPVNILSSWLNSLSFNNSLFIADNAFENYIMVYTYNNKEHIQTKEMFVKLCKGMETLPTGVVNFFKNSNIKSLYGCFRDCTALTSIPTGLFDDCVNVTSFGSCFYYCNKLTTIPTRLFDKNVNVTDFSYCFRDCTALTSIPQGLFDTCVNVTDFSYCFYYCSSLTTIPQGLFDNNVNVTSFDLCFTGCNKLTTIPTGLFDKCVNVTSFNYCFSSCSSLTTIPSGLFDKCVNVTNFNYCFRNCSSLDQPYNCTSPNLPKLWERDGTNGAVAVTSYIGFAEDAHTTFRNTVPTTWGGTLTI